MKKIIFTILKRIIFAFCVVYAFDLIGAGLNIFIPINVITIFVVSSLGMSGLSSLVAVYLVLF